MIDHLQGLRTELALVRSALGGDLDASVPSCPDWRVRDLVHHLGTVHRMFRRVADEGWMERPPPPDVDDRPDADDDAVVAWSLRQADLLVAALAELDPGAPRWNFTTEHQVGAFIPRRMHHETLVHRWDLQRAFGDPGPIDPEVALDGLCEYLGVFVPRVGGWAGPAAVIHTVVVGGPTLELVVTPGERPATSPVPACEPGVVVTGPSVALLLAWWDRLPLHAHVDAGDAALLMEVRRFTPT